MLKLERSKYVLVETFLCDYRAHTFSSVWSVSSASWNKVGLPSTSKHSFLIEYGVGEAAKGYSFGSRSYRCWGAFILSGGKLVVVVVVVTTVVV